MVDRKMGTEGWEAGCVLRPCRTTEGGLTAPKQTKQRTLQSSHQTQAEASHKIKAQCFPELCLQDFLRGASQGRHSDSKNSVLTM